MTPCHNSLPNVSEPTLQLVLLSQNNSADYEQSVGVGWCDVEGEPHTPRSDAETKQPWLDSKLIPAECDSAESE